MNLYKILYKKMSLVSNVVIKSNFCDEIIYNTIPIKISYGHFFMFIVFNNPIHHLWFTFKHDNVYHTIKYDILDYKSQYCFEIYKNENGFYMKENT